MNCPSRLDKTGKEGLSGITCPVACQSRVAPRPKSGLPAQCGGGVENPWSSGDTMEFRGHHT